MIGSFAMPGFWPEPSYLTMDAICSLELLRCPSALA
jgi:hypothetical protein